MKRGVKWKTIKFVKHHRFFTRENHPTKEPSSTLILECFLHNLRLHFSFDSTHYVLNNWCHLRQHHHHHHHHHYHHWMNIITMNHFHQDIREIKTNIKEWRLNDKQSTICSGAEVSSRPGLGWWQIVWDDIQVKGGWEKSDRAAILCEKWRG